MPREVPCVLVLLLQLKPRNKGPPITQRPAPQLTPPHTHHLAGALSPHVVNMSKAVPMSFQPVLKDIPEKMFPRRSTFSQDQLVGCP